MDEGFSLIGWSFGWKSCDQFRVPIIFFCNLSVPLDDLSDLSNKPRETEQMLSLEGSCSYSRSILIIILQSSHPHGNFYKLLAAQIAFIVQLYKLNWSQAMAISSLLQEVHVWKCYIFNKRKTWSRLRFYNPTTSVVARNDYKPIMYFESAKTNSALLMQLVNARKTW